MTVLHDWFQTPPGQYLLDWERAQFDAALADVFGYHALQLGLADIDALAANRMPHRWLALSAAPPAVEPPAADAPAAARWALVTDSTALPFADASLDLVVLPHTLELSADPHATLREVQRVLVHEGKVAIAGLNPLSLWGLRQWRSHLYRGLGGGQPFLPEAGEFIAHWRLRDWLRLLGFEVEVGRFGCWRPPIASAVWLERWRWLDRIGEHWWPVLGAVYFVVAVKRVRGMRLVGLLKPERRNSATAAATVARRDAALAHAQAQAHRHVYALAGEPLSDRVPEHEHEHEHEHA